MKILFINLPYAGHIYPTLRLVEELRAFGHEVTYILTDEWRAEVEAAGARLVPYEKHWRLSSVMSRAYDTALRIGADYDGIVYEQFFFLGKHLADSLQKPVVRLFTSFATNQIIMDKFIHGGGFLGLFRSKFIRKRWTQRVKKEIRLMSEDWLSEIIDNPPGLNIVFVLKEFQLFSDEFPENQYKFVGPSISMRVSDRSIPYQHINSPLIYISLGTIENNAAAFYKKCFTAFAQEEVSVIMSVGSKLSIDRLGNIPENFMVYPYVPQLEVLQHADVFITHCGMNSVSEAMYYGVPIVAIPIANDQPAIADRIAELQLGIRLHKKTLTAKQLKDTTLAVLGDANIRSNMQSMKNAIRNAGGSQYAAREIVKYIGDTHR